MYETNIRKLILCFSRDHARPVIRLQMINEPADPLNGLPEPHAKTPKVKTKRKQVLITLSDSPLIQEHKVSKISDYLLAINNPQSF